MEAIAFGSYKRARAELGVSSFGMQVMDLPPNNDLYPEHDHADDGQEEVYVALSGSADIETMIKIGPGVTRRVFTNDEPLRLLIIGSAPGKLYEAPEQTELGGPDPFAERIQRALEEREAAEQGAG